jgi:hypothetical protein
MDVQPIVRRVAERAPDNIVADLAFPIIVTKSGGALDSANRVARAYLTGLPTLRAVVIVRYSPADGFVSPG